MERRLDCPVFDADNHMYEQPDAFTCYLPDEYKNVIKYVQVNGRDKLAIKNVISEYIPNPTFSVVARPGAQEEFFKNGNPEGKSRRELLGEPMRALDAFFKPEPRLELMDQQGIDRAIMWPTLASVLEERLHNDPEASHAIIHSLNQWMHEEWTFNYQDRIFPTPVITLPIVDQAIRELDWVVERGAKIILIRPAPVPSVRGFRSFALPEFDPFWAKVQEYDVTVGMHASDDGLTRYFNQWEGHHDEHLPFAKTTAFGNVQHLMSRGIFDAMASAVCHGMLSRFPTCAYSRSRTARAGCCRSSTPWGTRTRSNRASTRRTRSGSFAATCGSTPSSRRTPSASSRPSAPTASSSAPTTHTPRVWPTRSPTSRSSAACPRRISRRSWVATWPRPSRSLPEHSDFPLRLRTPSGFLASVRRWGRDHVTLSSDRPEVTETQLARRCSRTGSDDRSRLWAPLVVRLHPVQREIIEESVAYVRRYGQRRCCCR